MSFDFSRIDRRIIYLLVLLALSIPLLAGYAVPPARMKSAEKFFNLVEKLKKEPGKIALVVMDFGPNSMAENLPQAEVVVEHLMRKRIPFAIYSQYVLADPFLESIPLSVVQRLMKEMPDQKWVYGQDWVNLGYRPGGSVMVQNIAKADSLVSLFKKDVRGNSLSDLPIFNGTKGLESISLVTHFTSLVGTLDTLLQFMKNKDYRPPMAHGCTSITIPQAFIYLDSGQLGGLLEGVAGAAWYSALLKKQDPARGVDSSQTINTGLGVAHLVIILLVVIGNIAALVGGRKA